MKTCRRVVSRPLPVAVFVIFVWPGTVWAQQDSIRTAQSLYASAAYDEALALLDRLHQAAPTPADQRLIQQSRALCLLALGRDAEAESAIGAVVGADPLFRPDPDSSSPRVRAAFAEVRARVLPGVIADRYRIARELFDAGEWAAAVQVFTEIGALASDPDLEASTSRTPVGDYRVLSEGFVALARHAQRPKPVGAGGSANPETVAVTRVYDASAADVTPPVTLSQQLPRWPSSAFPPPSSGGLVEVTINERGTVESARIAQPMSPLYDPLLLEAARGWLYEPARRAGQAVRFRKVIRVEFQ